MKKKQFLSAALAAALSSGMVFQALAATQLATPSVRWSESEEAFAQWTRIEDASGKYQVECYVDGERFYNSRYSMSVTSTDEWLTGRGILNKLEVSGIYQFRVMALGDDIDTLDSEWSELSPEWSLEIPTVQFDTPTNLRWDGTVSRWDPIEVPSGYEDYFKGYEVAILGDGERIHTILSTGKVSCEYDEADHMDDEDVEEYTFTVRAISNTPSKIFHGELAYCDEVYNTSNAAASVSSMIDSISGDDEALANAPDELSQKLSDVQVAMQTDAEVLEKLSELEEQYSELKGLNLEYNVADNTGIDAGDVKVVGALLNAESEDTTVSFNITKPSREAVVDAAAYKNSIQFDFHLDGTVSTLKVPVRVTVPIPSNINPEFLRVLHEVNGNLVEVYPVEIEDGMASFTVTSFSTFVFAEEGMDIAAVATPSNAAEFKALADALPDADPENPLYNPLEGLDDEEREEAEAGVWKLVRALSSSSSIGRSLLEDEDMVYKLSAILYWLGGDRIYPEYDMDTIQRVAYHSLAFAEELDEIEGLRVELADVATPSNATGKFEFDLKLYKTVDGEEKEESSLKSPMKFMIPLPEGYTCSSLSGDSQTVLEYDEDSNCVILYTVKLGRFSISIRKTSSGSSDSSGSSGSSGSGSRGKSSTVRLLTKSPAGGSWVKSGESYGYRFSDGTTAADCWLEIEWNNTKHWYYFDVKGVMATGWMKDNKGNWYYLNPTAEGVYGSMVTGWQFIDGKWYYFHEKNDGFKGTMLSDTTTPDGYRVNKNGAWIQ